MTIANIPDLSVAPMEGLTTFVFRRVHAELFGGADLYYLPFVTPTSEPRFTERQLRELDPVNNQGFSVIAQLLTRRAEDFLWAAHALAKLGYTEVNLNLGCPAGTVVAKGKGSGFLADPTGLRTFFEQIFAKPLPIAVSVKTRIGYKDPLEFEDLVRIYNDFPISRLIVHPRLKTDQYRGNVRLDVLQKQLQSLKPALVYNGDIVTPHDVFDRMNQFQSAPGGLTEIMIGRGLMADPALLRKVRGGSCASNDEIERFHRALFDAYIAAWGNVKNAMMRMKEYWFYQLNLFEDIPNQPPLAKVSKTLFRAKEVPEFEAAVAHIIHTYPIREHAQFGWFKPE